MENCPLLPPIQLYRIRLLPSIHHQLPILIRQRKEDYESVRTDEQAPLPLPTAVLTDQSLYPSSTYLHPVLRRVKRGGGGEDVFKRGDDTDLLNPPPILPPRIPPVGQEDDARSNGMPDTRVEQQKDECYFKHTRKTIHETEPIPLASMIKSSCSDEKNMKRMSELIDHHYPNQYGSPNALALLLWRGEGKTVDWTDDNEIEAISKNYICANHERELGSDWEDRHHFRFRDQGGRTRPICSMPDPFFQYEDITPLYRGIHYIEADEAEAILRKKGVLLHPGIPICSDHGKIARKIAAQVVVENEGDQIRPPPIGGDFSRSTTISENVNPFFDARDRNDPTYHSHKIKPPVVESLGRPSTREVKDAYIEFVHKLGLAPHISEKEWHQLSDRAQRRDAESLRHVAHEIAAQMCPAYPQSLIDKAFKAPMDYERPRPEEYEQLFKNVKEAFESSDALSDRLAYVSMIAHFAHPEIQRHIPGLTKYFLKEAKMYSKRGYHLEEVHHGRVKYNQSENRTRRVKDTRKRIVEIPNSLRKLRAGEIYHLYEKDLADKGETDKHIPQSTMEKMINICQAERRKSLHGVDVIIADAMEAFDDSEHLIDKLLDENEIDKSLHSTLRTEMLQTRQYLRTDYLLHTKEYSTITDHCWSYALSDPDVLEFQHDCLKGPDIKKHKHTRVCDRCEAQQIWFGDMRALLEELEEKYKDDPIMKQKIAVMRSDWYHWEELIDKLKAHQLRTAKAENDRQWIIAGLGEGDGMATMDFAMKHPPLQARERTVDWYAQRGMPWHITHVTVKRDGEYYQHSIVHVFKESERQDSTAMTAIIRHNLQLLKKQGVKKLTLKSDQAGAYKSSSTLASIQSIAKEVGGIEVVGYYFSEAQAGKGPCDCVSAEVKTITRNCADAGGSVMNSLEFFAAVSTSRHREGISYHLVSLHGNEKETKPNISSYVIPEMSKLNAFTFEEDSVRVYRYWNIGTGREEYYEDMVPNDARLLIHNSGGKLSNDDFWHKLGVPRYSEKQNQPENEEEEVETEIMDSKKKKRTKLESTLYRCPVETCRKEFMSEKNLEKHMTVGKHESHPEKMNVLDYTLRRFGANLEKTAPPPKVCPVIDNALESLTEESNANGRILDMGWALPKRRPSIRFPVAVKQFLKQIYDDGERTGSKTDARGAASLMRTAKNDDGGMLFIPEDLLTSRQVAGVYTGFKKTKLDKRDRTKAGGARAKTSEDEERNEVTELFNTEGDPELEWETEPLFDDTDAFRVAIKKAKTALFDGDECDENGEPDPKKPKFFP